MKKIMSAIEILAKSLNIWVHMFLIKNLTTVHCGQSVITSGEDANNNNCFWVSFKKDANTYLGIESYDQGNFICRKYLDSLFVDELIVNKDELIKYNIEIIHFFKFYRIEIHGIYKFLATFLIYKIYVILSFYWNKLSQFLFNQRSLSSKKRYEFLKLLIENFTARDDGFSYTEVMANLHTIKVFLHPSFNKEASRIQALLDGLTDTHELRVINGNYHLTGMIPRLAQPGT